MLTKINAGGGITRDLGPDFHNPCGLACKDTSLYVSEFDRGVIVKIDLGTFLKTDFTIDTGISSAGAIAFDAYDRLYTRSFRQQKLFRLNPSGQFDQIGAGTGYSQQIASDGTYFYLGSSPTIPNVERQILRIDPASGNTTVVAYGNQNVKGWRSLAFDSYGRLILNTEIDINQNLYGADIIDLATGSPTPYVPVFTIRAGTFNSTSIKIYISSKESGTESRKSIWIYNMNRPEISAPSRCSIT